MWCCIIYIKIRVKFDYNSFIDFVTSDTLLGDSAHPSGAVVAEIVKANIPVKNGVVHLISRPLMVVDNTVKQFIEVSVNTCLRYEQSNL